jgi:hypothetical protein
LQRNINRADNCEIRNMRINIVTRFHAPNPGKAPGRSFQPNIVTCSTCFIRCRSGVVFPPLKKPWAGANDIDNNAIIGRAHRINSRTHGNRQR